MDRIEEFDMLLHELSVDDLISLRVLLQEYVQDRVSDLAQHQAEEKTDA